MPNKQNLLVICSRNKKRSLTAEKIFQNHPLFTVRSAGTSPSARRKVTQADITWADLIWCMEEKHKELLEQKFGRDLPPIQVLDIPDEYEYMDSELVEMLERQKFA